MKIRKNIFLVLFIFLLLVSTVNAELYFGSGYTNASVIEPKSIQSSGISLSGGLRQQLFGILYGKLGYESDIYFFNARSNAWDLAKGEQAEQIVTYFHHNFLFGLGLPVYRSENNFALLEIGGAFSTWEYKYISQEKKASDNLFGVKTYDEIGSFSGNGIIPFIQVGFFFTKVFGIEAIYKFGDGKKNPNGFNISLVLQTISIDESGKSVFFKTDEESVYEQKKNRAEEKSKKIEEYLSIAEKFMNMQDYGSALWYYRDIELLLKYDIELININKIINTIYPKLMQIKNIFIKQGIELYEANKYTESLAKFAVLKSLEKFLSGEDINKINTAKLIIGEKYLLNAETTEKGIEILKELISIPGEIGWKSQNILSMYDFKSAQKLEKEENMLKYFYWIISVYNPLTDGAKLASEEIKKYEKPTFEKANVLESKKEWQEAINLLTEKIIKYSLKHRLANEKINYFKNMIEEELRKKETEITEREKKKKQAIESKRMEDVSIKIKAWAVLMQPRYSQFGVTLSSNGDMLIFEGLLSVLSQLPMSDIMESIGLLGGRWIQLRSVNGKVYDTLEIPYQFRRNE